MGEPTPAPWSLPTQRMPNAPLPRLMKIVVVQKPAVPAHTGINPFTKQPMTFKAKPARRVVRVRPLKALKEMAK